MKIGIRTPSLSKSIKARTTGKAKRTIKKAVNPMYGKKGTGWASNPKKAAYNKVYNKTTVGVPDILKSSGSPKTSNKNASHTSQRKKQESLKEPAKPKDDTRRYEPLSKETEKYKNTVNKNQAENQTGVLAEKLLRKYSIKKIKVFRAILITLGIFMGILSITALTTSFISSIVMIILAIILFSIARDYKKVIKYTEKDN